MVSVHDVPPTKLILEIAKELKKFGEISPPEWVAFVKTGAHRERPPKHSDFWYVRASALLRTLHKSGPVGVSKLRSKYGGRRNLGVKPEKFRKGSGAILRRMLIQLEQAGLVKKETKGRSLTAKGVSMLDKTAAKLARKTTN